MATFKETFAAKRKELGAGKTFTWKDKNGKVGTYTTDYATEKKQSAPTASDKPKARPAGLNPQSGAAQSGTKGKVTTKPNKFYDKNSGYTYQHLPGKGRDAKAEGLKAVPATSGASRSTAGKVKPKVDMPARPTGGAKAKQIARTGATSSKVASNIAAEKRKPVVPKQSVGSRVMSASAKAGAIAGDALKKILSK